ncbi:MAG: UvrD-helicase domain-containing protein [Arcobacteraceae bacterium]|nr:UvrD-helicase domain-containing protein [Arcobacteraceae bacterium]
MKHLQKQIEQHNTQIQKLENAINDSVIKITKLKDDISSIEQESTNIVLKIADYKDKINQLPIKFQPNIFQILIKLFSFGIKNYEKDYLSKLETFNIETQKLQDILKSKKQNISNIKQIISAEQIEKNKNTQKIEHYKIYILNLENEFAIKLELFKNTLTIFQTKIIQLSKSRYINDYTRNDLKHELKSITNNQCEFITHQKIKNFIQEVILFYNDDILWVKNKNTSFVRNKMIDEKIFFDTIESKPLTKKQQEAVLVNENNNLILAGAGSGKTSVVVAKVCYLIQKKVLHPNEILILAFNKNAQEELQERFDKKNLNVQIKTFHAFGLNIIAQSMSKKFDLCPMTESQNNMNKFINDTIFRLLASMGTFLKEFTQFIAYFSIPYKNESAFNSLGEYYDYQKDFDMKTLKHKVEIKGDKEGENLTTLKEETVKSYQELVICNFLTLNGIKYLYEEPYEIKTWTTQRRQYKPDLYLPDYGIYIEHFGIDRNGRTAPYIDNHKYLEGMEWKRNLHAEKQTIMVETFSYEFTDGNLLPLLKEKLLSHNVIFREPNEAEIYELLKEHIESNKFTKLFITFLSHFKSNRHTIEDIKEKSKEIERSSLFINLFEFIFKEYQDFQKRNNCIDFDDMIIEALNNIDNGKYKHGFKHIFIDEFQDISTTRAMLIKSLLPLNNTSITAVGDDWQSINRFAGSNIKIIQDFEKTFGISKTVALDYTFRFNNTVSDIASNFIQKNPNQLKKEIKTIKTQELNKFSILLYWSTADNQKDLEVILSHIIKKEKENKKTVMILARYNFLLDNLKIKHYPTLKIKKSSVHGSKGNEADYVIILNLDNGKFGFPSKIVDDPILDIVVPPGDEFEDAEERRLFYVALTRTKSALFLVSNQYSKSVFMEELIRNYKNEIYFINDSNIKLTNCPECKTGVLKKNTTHEDKKKHFYGCCNYPRCKYTDNVHYCPQCLSETIKNLENKVAQCSNNECDFESALCVKCNGYMIRRNGQFGEFLGCSNYPNCNHSERIQEEKINIIDNKF